jgi:O-antigen/teichoic acid export membrane protein
MNLIKTSVMSFIVTILKMLSALIINKFLALFVGPSGLALMGQLQSFIQLSVTVGQAGMNSGVTKYAAEYDSNHERKKLFSTVIKISFIASVIFGGGIAVFSNEISQYLFSHEEFSHVFILFGFTLVLYSINYLLLAILNGLGEMQFWFKANVFQSVYGLLISVSLIWLWGIEGAFIAMVTNQSIVLLVLLYMLRNHSLVNFKLLKTKFDSKQAKKLLAYSFMALTSAAVVPVSHILLRMFIIEDYGIDSAGYWQGLWYVSSMYLMVFTSTLSVYFLPKLSSLSDKSLIKNELIRGIKYVVPIAAVIAVIIYNLKEIVIYILFSDDFLEMAELFGWQLVGDVIKITSWFFGYLMIAKAKVKLYVFCEIGFSSLFLCLAVLLMNEFGLIGVTYAYALNYSLYLVCSYYFTRNEFKAI